MVRKLPMLKTSIEDRELVAKKFGYTICSSDIQIKSNIEEMYNKLKFIQAV